MAKKYELEWTEAAKNDLNEIVDYIALDSFENAIKIYNKIILKVESLSLLPKRGRIVPELNKFGFEFYREIFIGPYRVFYEILNKSNVIILGIFDGRRDLEELLIQRLINL